MSPRCTDADLGKLLHPYELGHLSEEDTDRFEAHLLACDHCAAELEAFEKPAALLTSSIDVRAMATRYSQEAPTLLSRLKKAFWPEGRLLLKPAIAYAAVALLLYPAYLGLRSPDTIEPTGATTILLTGTRAISSPPAAGDKPLVLYFRVPGHRAGTTYEVALKASDSTVVYEDYAFTTVDEREMGTIVLPAGLVTAGEFKLHVTLPDGTPVQEYVFDLK